MKKFVGTSIEEAINKASDEFACSPKELEYEVILSPSQGFLGMFKRDAVILARKIAQSNVDQDLTKGTEISSFQEQNKILDEASQYEGAKFQSIRSQEDKSQDSYSQIQDNFFQEKNTPQEMEKRITQELRELLSFLPYKIDKIEVRIDGEECIVELNGEDCGLLIGEKGYRYQSLHYLLCVWIRKEYGLALRLEIANFLKNKEKKIDEYIEEHYDRMISRTSFQTQGFDPLTATIALRRFRESIPNKYISLKEISEIESVIVISEFRSR